MATTDNNVKEFTSDDEASPRAILETPVSETESDNSGSSESFSCVSPEKSQAVTGKEVPKEGYVQQLMTMIDVFKFKSVRKLTAVPLFAVGNDISRKGLTKKLARIRSAEDGIDIGAIPTKPSWRNFDYEELVAATGDFSSENLLGKGGHAEVYKGHLPDGQVIAVKRLMKNEKDAADRAGDFLTELGIIAHINHPNATRLIGFGVDRGLYFVLQLASHGSLSSLLFGVISDFGLAKWLPSKWTSHVVFPIEGTFGYLAPEYFMHGVVDEKTDVFAYGVLLLELITGRRAVDSDSRQSLVIWAKPLLDTNNVKDLADPRLGEEYDPIEMKRAMVTASRCVHHVSSKRPYMNQVVQLLKGEETIMEPKKTLVAQKSLMLEACDLEEDYTCSSYLKDLNRHRQLIME
ncbi:hypothetical protein JHK85_026288 [Glycine max]|nr:hypothetical protein JHK85_026288 [Glycine max]